MHCSALKRDRCDQQGTSTSIITKKANMPFLSALRQEKSVRPGGSSTGGGTEKSGMPKGLPSPTPKRQTSGASATADALSPPARAFFSSPLGRKKGALVFPFSSASRVLWSQ